MNNLLTVLLMTPSDDQNPYVSTIFLVGILVVFYFFLMRPQIKRQKESKKFRESLAKGDKVLTVGGIHGKIVEIKETYALVEVDSNTRIRVEKSALVKDAEGLPQQR